MKTVQVKSSQSLRLASLRLWEFLFKRPCRYIFTHSRYTFFQNPIFGIIHWFWAKTPCETHPTGFLRSKRWILGFWIFFPEKSWIFRQKTENIFLLILFVPKRPETHSRHDLLLFLPYKSIKMCKKAIFSKFWPF